jgi:methyl-accepting chemotaxis protein
MFRLPCRAGIGGVRSSHAEGGAGAPESPVCGYCRKCARVLFRKYKHFLYRYIIVKTSYDIFSKNIVSLKDRQTKCFPRSQVVLKLVSVLKPVCSVFFGRGQVMKLSLKIPLLVIITIFIVSISIGLSSIIISSTMVEESANRALVNQAVLGTDLIRDALYARLAVLQELANREGVQSMDWNWQRRSLLPNVERAGYLDLGIVDKRGLAHYIKDESSANLADRDYVIKALGGAQAVSDVLISRVTNKPVVMYAVPIIDSSGSVAGALIGRQDGSALNQTTKKVKHGNSGYSYMTNKDGVVISHRDINLVLHQHNLIAEAEETPLMRPLANAIRASQNEGSGFVRYVYNDKKMAAGFASIPEFSWTLFVTIDDKELTAGIDRLIFLIISFMVVFIIAGLAAAYFLGRSIAKPIGDVAYTLCDIAGGEGDLTQEIPVKNTKDRDELSDLAYYFNLTIKKIRALVIDVKNKVISLSVTGEELAVNMTETTDAINQIAANILGVKTRVVSQNNGIKKTDASMEQITGSVSELNESVGEQHRGVSKSVTAIQNLIGKTNEALNSLNENMHSIQELASASGVGKAGVQEVSANIQEICRESEDLLKFNEVMENIAGQTNLLSMNAAIEAAHAGESGKGFAVVAAEIRKLAESSSEQSKTINIVLKKIKSAIDKIGISAEDVLKKFEAIDRDIKIVTAQEERIQRVMKSQEYDSGILLEAINKLSELTGKVKEVAQNMLAESGNVINESTILKSKTGEITEGMTEMAIGAEQINHSVNHVNDISIENKEHVEDLVKAVSRFKV